MSDFKAGDIVDITIKGGRIEGVLDDGETVALGIEHEDGVSVTLPVATPGFTITRVAPEVRLADLWRDAQGTLWFVVQTDEEDAPLEMRGHCDSVCSPQYVATTFGPLTLVHPEAAE